MCYECSWFDHFTGDSDLGPNIQFLQKYNATLSDMLANMKPAFSLLKILRCFKTSCTLNNNIEVFIVFLMYKRHFYHTKFIENFIKTILVISILILKILTILILTSQIFHYVQLSANSSSNVEENWEHLGAECLKRNIVNDMTYIHWCISVSFYNLYYKNEQMSRCVKTRQSEN